MITWRTVTAPNNGAANNLASRGIETLLNGLGNLGNRLRKPKEDEKLAEKEAFERQVLLNRLDQGQQRIDNQEDQFESTAAARVLAADVVNQNQRDRDIRLNTFDKENAAINNANKVKAAEVLATNRVKEAEILAASRNKSKGKDNSTKSFTQDIIKTATDMPTEQALNMISLSNHLDTHYGHYPAGLRKAIIDSTYKERFLVDRERLSGIGAIDSPEEFDNYISKFVTNTDNLGPLAPAQQSAREIVQKQRNARKALQLDK